MLSDQQLKHRIFGTIKMMTNRNTTPVNPHQNISSDTRLSTRLISLTLIAGMLNMVSLPVQAAAIDAERKAQQTPKSTTLDEDAYSKISELVELGSVNKAVIAQAAQTGRSIHKVEWYNALWQKITLLFTDSEEQIAQHAQDQKTIEAVLALRINSMQDHTQLMQALEQQATQMKARGTSAEIMQRHQQLIRDLHARYTTLQGLLTALATAKQQGRDADLAQALTALEQQLKAWQPARAQTNMTDLPWGTPNSDIRAPITAENAGDFKPANYGHTATHGQYGAIGQWRSTEYRIAQYLQARQPIKPANNTALSGISNTGQWPVLKALPATIQDADLAANEDVQITPEIEKLAKDLGYQPAKIYKWVYDNIEYVPSYGSIQGSVYTLHTKRGNAFDTASLLIALLRASKVPARYVYGTVDIPTQTALDWVGGVNHIDAAQNLLGQGGVPNVAIMNGSQAVKLRLEHVWVEANIAMLPARGGKAVLNTDGTAANPNANPQWVPLDASYKQHIRSAGIDLSKAVPFDAQKLLNDVQASATINEAEGSVQNVDQSTIDSAISQYQQQLQQYLEQNAPDATVGDILGKTDIAPYQSKMLSPVLPYTVNTVISDYQTLPDSMRHYFKVNIYPDAATRRNTIAMGENPSFSVKIPTTRLQGQPLALSFKPSSQTDEDAILNALPKPHADGSPITAAELPSALPSTINMTPEVSLGGQTLKSEGSFRLGFEMAVDMGYISPNKTLPLASKTIRAGEYHAIGYDMQGLSQQQLEATKAQLERTKSKLESQQETQLASLTKHDITGAMLQAGVQSYFALNDAQDRIAQANTSIIQTPFMSFGTFSTYIQPKQVYGLTTAARLSGMMMDIDRLYGTAVDKDNKRENVVAFIASQGPRQSANEHLVPEALFDNPDSTEKEAEAISAVKALQIATQQGQKIFTINQTNISTVLPQLSHKATVIQDVKDAVAAGKIVTISQRTVSYQGWTGTGYIVTDPNTGAGAYLIGGGQDGGIIPAISGFLMGAMLSSIVALLALEFLETRKRIGFFGSTLKDDIIDVAAALAALFVAFINQNNYYKSLDITQRQCFMTGFVYGLGGVSIIGGIAVGRANPAWGTIYGILGLAISIAVNEVSSTTGFIKTCIPYERKD